MTPLTHSLSPTISKKTGLSHQHRLHVFKHTNSDCFPFRFYFNTKKCINTQRQDSRTSRTTTSDIWSSSANISSRYILFWIRINSCYYCALLLLPWVLFEICIFSFSIPSSFLVPSKINKKLFSVFLFHTTGVLKRDKCWVTDAKVMTFAASLEMCT